MGVTGVDEAHARHDPSCCSQAIGMHQPRKNSASTSRESALSHATCPPTFCISFSMQNRAQFSLHTNPPQAPPARQRLPSPRLPTHAHLWPPVRRPPRAEVPDHRAQLLQPQQRRAPHHGPRSIRPALGVPILGGVCQQLAQDLQGVLPGRRGGGGCCSERALCCFCCLQCGKASVRLGDG